MSLRWQRDDIESYDEFISLIRDEVYATLTLFDAEILSRQHCRCHADDDG